MSQTSMELIEHRAAPPTLLVVIVNYRTPALTIDCLASLESQVRELGACVTVTDNASGDDSVSRLQSAIREQGWSDWVQLMPLERNGGFAYGNNAAIRDAMENGGLPESVLLLNPDTVVRPGAIRALVDFLASHPEAGIVGSQLEDPDETPQISAYRFPTIAGELDTVLRLKLFHKLIPHRVIAPAGPAAACRTDWVSGASMLVRRKVFDDIGLLDEGYFMYYEEVDFCRRANRAGWACWFEPVSRVVHLVGQASGVTCRVAVPRRRPSYWFQSRTRYWAIHHGRFYLAMADLTWLTGYGMWWLRRKILRRPMADPPWFWWDFLRHSSLVRGGVR